MAHRDSTLADGTGCHKRMVVSGSHGFSTFIAQYATASLLASSLVLSATIATANPTIGVMTQLAPAIWGQTDDSATSSSSTSTDRQGVINRFVRRNSEKKQNPPRLFTPWFGRNKQSQETSLSEVTDPLQIEQEQQLNDLIDPSRLRAKEHLEKGRLSLSQGNISGAVAWYQKAVSENAQYEPEDYSPEQLRTELEAAGVQNLSATSDRLQPPSIRPPTVTPNELPVLVNTDALDDRKEITNSDSPRPIRQSITNPFSSSVSGLPGPQFATGYEATPTATPNPRQPPSQSILLEARLALAAGNFDRAQQLVNQASQNGVVSPLQRDTPQQVAALIRRCQAVRNVAGAIEPAQANYQQARLYMEQAEGLLDYEEFKTAMQLAEKAGQQQAQFQADESNPLQLMRRIHREIATSEQSGSSVSIDQQELGSTFDASQSLGRSFGAVATASGTKSSAKPSAPKIARAIYDPTADPTRNELATATGKSADRAASGNVAHIIRLGEQALADNQLEIARTHFIEALSQVEDISPEQQQQLQDRLQMVSARSVAPTDISEPSALPKTEAKQTLAWRRWVNEIASQQREAQKIGQDDPIAALDKLKDLRDQLNQSDLTRNQQQTLAARIDVSIGRLEQFIEENKATIDFEQKNRAIKNEIELERQHKLDAQQKLAQLVEEFNDLLDEERFSEAELIARQARQIDPDNPITETLLWNAKFIKHYNRSIRINEESQEGFLAAAHSIDEGAVPFDDTNPFEFGKDWKQLTKRRKGFETQNRYSKSELEIQEKLSTPVEVRFENRPLQEVMDTLAQIAGINIFLDPLGLSAEAVTTNELININLTGSPVSLRSALNLILEPLQLNYVIQNEVLKITSEQMHASDVYQETYYVADLVTPIPNFNPSYNIGLPAAMQAAHDIVGYTPPNNGIPMSLASGDTDMATDVKNPNLLAQMMGPGMGIPGQTGTVRGPMGIGPGAAGGGAQADFESLIELITTTVSPDSWDEVGGPGAIKEFEGNLSLVVSQTQDVHDQIADLLEQLRRLQDLQVTIEVRFITLSDDFFERMGVDFDFEIEDNTGRNLAEAVQAQNEDNGPSFTVGLDPVSGLPTADLDLKFNQGSFNSAVPAFGGFDPMTAANFGFAILSDIEAYFVIEAAHGDTRTNVMQSPKVTLFNGQQASVVDVSQQPFVTSIIPVVGDFSAAHQPVITVLNSGTTLSVQAVVSPDRRFVRLTLVPFFSQIGHVRTFTFNGRTSANTGTIAVDPSDEEQTVQNDVETFTEGTTVQLPEFVFTTVTTTVSVPDGGTVLLGGIKRLREGRTETGVPMLAKLPYVNRLFKNVGVGREAQSLMLMVTPRIIIQEEEEELMLGGAP